MGTKTDPEVTRLLQTHVTSMLARGKDGRAMHRRDPLFAELLRYADRIEARHELTAVGVRVVETSQDAYVAKLLPARSLDYMRSSPFLRVIAPARLPRIFQ